MDANFLRGSVRSGGWTQILSILRNRNTLIMLLIGVPILGFITFSPRGIVKRLSLEVEVTKLQDSVMIASERLAQLQTLSRELDHDLRAIETVARVKYGMVRPGETVYKVKKGS